MFNVHPLQQRPETAYHMTLFITVYTTTYTEYSFAVTSTYIRSLHENTYTNFSYKFHNPYMTLAQFFCVFFQHV